MWVGRVITGVFALFVTATQLLAADGLYSVRTPLASDRSNHPMVVLEGRGYFLRCQDSDGAPDFLAEEEVVRALGFQNTPQEVELTDTVVLESGIDENPLLCPNSSTFAVRLFRSPADSVHYLQFPRSFDAPARLPRLYRPGCVELIAAFGLQLHDAQEVDPTVFIDESDIHNLPCLAGSALPSPAVAFADWCVRSDLNDSALRLVKTLLNRTSVTASGLGNRLSCDAAQAELDRLTGLTLNDLELSDLSPMGAFAKLERLSLRGNAIQDIAPLARHAALKSLDISGNDVESLGPLAVLDKLERLWASDNPRLADVQPVTGLAGLTALDLSRTGVRNLSPMPAIPMLEVLKLSGNALTEDDLGPLLLMPALQELDLSNNTIADSDVLSRLPSTMVLNSEDNPIWDSPAPSFVEMCLRLRNTPTAAGRTMDAIIETFMAGTLTCADAANQASGLLALDLASTGISSLEPLVAMPHLQDLTLTDNQIADISVLALLEDLKRVRLNNNLIVDIEPLAHVPFEGLIELSENPVRLGGFLTACLAKRPDLVESLDVLEPPQEVEASVLLEFVPERLSCLEKRAHLRALTSVNMWNRNLTELTFVEELHSARELVLGGNDITDISAISDLTALVELDFQAADLIDLSPLSNKSNLVELNLGGNYRIKQFDALAPLVTFSAASGLEDLFFHDDIVLENTGLGGDCVYWRFQLRNALSTSPQDVDFSWRNTMRRIIRQVRQELGPFDTCAAFETLSKDLTTLNLRNWERTNFASVLRLVGLKELLLENAEVEDPTPLFALPNLEILELSDNPLSGDLTVKHETLRVLRMDRTGVGLRSDSFAPSLTFLDLRNNDLADIKVGVEDLPNLGRLDARNNKIAGLGGANGWIVPPVIRLKGNPICATPGPGVATPAVFLGDVCERESATQFNRFEIPDLFVNDTQIIECLENPICRRQLEREFVRPLGPLPPRLNLILRENGMLR